MRHLSAREYNSPCMLHHFEELWILVVCTALLKDDGAVGFWILACVQWIVFTPRWVNIGFPCTISCYLSCWADGKKLQFRSWKVWSWTYFGWFCWCICPIGQVRRWIFWLIGLVRSFALLMSFWRTILHGQEDCSQNLSWRTGVNDPAGHSNLLWVCWTSGAHIWIP